MKIRKNEVHGREKIELQMTPMIDIVFQLLVFFIMTFKIVAMEGDFNIKMPQASAGQATTEVPPIPLVVKLNASDSGKLTSVLLNGRAMPGNSDLDFMRALQKKIIDLIDGKSGPGSLQEEGEIEIDAASHLKYHYVIQTITAVTGKVGEDGKIIKLIEKIKFSPGGEAG
ncbi:MAG: biopolymer transporter ExbD [Blastopirellula sp.]|nr:MAG: biopolymer transporter ExbD [Blastopirellula sp.]